MMFITLGVAVNWIEAQLKFKPKSDLDRMQAAYQMLDIHLDDIKKIHVAGTNGKGSVCSYLTHVLMEAGYHVGTYTSPYLLKFNERLRYDFIDIEDQDLLESINFIYDFNEYFLKTFGETLSFFELLTLMSMRYFEMKQVDVIVMEVGLGGLLDATNVLNYDLSLICSIGFDHMRQLGNTLESIAYNKLGILKPGNHLITTVDPTLHPFFEAHVSKVGATANYYTEKDVMKISDLPLSFVVDDIIYTLSMIGDFQLLNALLAIQAIRYLLPNLEPSIIQKGLKKAIWPGRLDRVKEKNIYIDGAHNTHAIQALEKTSKSLFKHQKIWVLFSALGDKDIVGMLEIISGFAERITLTSFPDFRFQPLEGYETKHIPYIEGALVAMEKLEKEMDDIIDIIADAQQDDGYLYVSHICKIANPREMGETPYSWVVHSHELYNLGHMYEGAIAYYRATGK
ncbi:MAG: glycoside hydrolase family 127 protein, partial [Acholeplasmataceae bacterium]|nr:glycoside hydrolase family 127 protein [Acholeplasmataceae bacterium]